LGAGGKLKVRSPGGSVGVSLPKGLQSVGGMCLLTKVREFRGRETQKIASGNNGGRRRGPSWKKSKGEAELSTGEE